MARWCVDDLVIISNLLFSDVRVLCVCCAPSIRIQFLAARPALTQGLKKKVNPQDKAQGFSFLATTFCGTKVRGGSHEPAAAHPRVRRPLRCVLREKTSRACAE
jgi:hypothetical protein